MKRGTKSNVRVGTNVAAVIRRTATLMVATQRCLARIMQENAGRLLDGTLKATGTRDRGSMSTAQTDAKRYHGAIMVMTARASIPGHTLATIATIGADAEDVNLEVAVDVETEEDLIDEEVATEEGLTDVEASTEEIIRVTLSDSLMNSL